MIATGDDARRIMKIGTWYDTVEETLFNLGLPPNRPVANPASSSTTPTAAYPKPLAAPTSIPARSCNDS